MIQKKRKIEQKSFFLKKEEVERNWFVLDAEGKTLGRFACEVAKVLRGKHKPTFTPSTDGGDGVIIINAEKIVLTGAKEAQKNYVYYTGHLGGQRAIPFKVMQARKPEYIIEHAVKGMMPKTVLGRKQMTRLRIFAGAEHGLHAQQPVTANI